jgi:flagellar biosynthetic protein FliR
MILVFLSLNGHLMVLSALSSSFRELPIGQPLSADGWKLLVAWGGQIFSAGLWISLPVVAALLITNLAIGILSRAAPQLNIFAVGFPFTLAAGFALVFLTLPYQLPMIDRLITEGVGALMEIVRQARLPK